MRSEHAGDEIEGLLRRVRPGHSLPGPFYREPGIFAAEVERIIAAQWMMVGHASEIAEPGAYRRIDVAGQSIILVRDLQGGVHALHNVCRHRGAQVCEAAAGHARRFTCRYHAWSYGLDGSLVAWRHMPDDLDRRDYGLHRCGVREFEGLIFVALDSDRAPDFDALTAPVRRYWTRYRLAECRVALHETYAIEANWKLAVENNLECYHCLPSHPEYRALHAFVKADEKVSDAATSAFLDHRDRVTTRLQQANAESGRSDTVIVAGQIARAGVIPLADGIATASAAGLPVAPLLGELSAYDESTTTGCFGFHSYLFAANDYALAMTYVPRTALHTEVVARWLVRSDAVEGRDYDLDKLRWLWDETTKQDKDLIELNARGVASRAYAPGPYSDLEGGTADFVHRYVALMQGPAGHGDRP